MNNAQIVDVVKTLKKTELVFSNGCTLTVGKSDIKISPVDGGDELISIFPEIRKVEYRVLYSSATLNKQGTSTATELREFWESNNFFFDIGSQTIADGRVEFRADLPVTISFPAIGAIYVVEKPTLILGVWKQYPSGFYLKDADTGSLNDWRKLNTKTRYTTNEFRLLDSTDQSKQAAFDASQITTATTRAYILPNQDGKIALDKNHLLTVAKAGGNFTTIKAALDSITDNSETSRYTILVAPGVYSEDNPLQGKSYVDVIANGMHTVRVVAANPNQDLFIGAHLFYLIGFSFVDVVGVNNYSVNMSVAGEMLIKDCVDTDCSNGTLVNNASALMNILNHALFTPSISMNKGITVLAGNVTLSLVKVIADATIDEIIAVDGSSSILSPYTIQSASPNVNKGFHFTGGARVSGVTAKLVNMVDGMVISGNNTDVRIDSLKIFNAQNEGLRIDNLGTDVNLAIFATTIADSIGLDFNILNPNSTISGSISTQLDKTFIVEGSQFFAGILDATEGDAGLHILGELKVGTPENPTESSMGEGDSTARGMKVFTFDGSTYVDVTANAASASGSTFTYPNLLVNSAIYITSQLIQSGDFYQHHGLKTFVNTAAVGGEIVIEYWNGSTWAELNGSEIQAAGKYFPFAKQYFQQLGICQLRYDPALVNDDWTKNDPMTLGTNFYWVRFRIDTQITTAPIFEQWKYHTSRFEPNEDGFIEYSGKARPIGQLSINIGSSKPIAGNMQDQSLWVSDNIGVGFVKNKFTTTPDILGFNGRLPFNVDTSAPISLIWGGIFSQSHTPEFTIRWGWLSPGDTIFTSNPAAQPKSDSLTVSRAVLLDINEVFEAQLDISELIARRENGFGDELWISIQVSTLSGTFTVSTGTADYVKWCEGGHI